MKKMRKLFSVLISAGLAMTMMCAGASAASKNLIKNGDASDGMNGWTDPDKAWTTSDKEVKTYDGKYFWPGNKAIAKSHIYQDVSVKNYVGQEVTLSAYVRDYSKNHGDESIIKIEFFDANGKSLDSGSAGAKNNASWKKLSVVKTVPKGSVTARVSLCGVRHNGSDLDSYFDNVELTASGEAASTETGCLTLTLKKGASVQLGIDTSDTVTYSTSKKSVATVSSSGKVTAKAKGTATIIAKFGTKTQKIIIKVTA